MRPVKTKGILFLGMTCSSLFFQCASGFTSLSPLSIVSEGASGADGAAGVCFSEDISWS